MCALLMLHQSWNTQFGLQLPPMTLSNKSLPVHILLPLGNMKAVHKTFFTDFLMYYILINVDITVAVLTITRTGLDIKHINTPLS